MENASWWCFLLHCSLTAPFNNMWNLKFTSTPTVVFFAAVNHNLNICTSTINGLWKTETYKNDKMDQIHQSHERTRPFDPVSTDREKQKPSLWIESHQSQWRTWPFDPVELILLTFSKTYTTMIDGRENATISGYLNFRFRMLLKGTATYFLSFHLESFISPPKNPYKVV